MPRSRSSQSCPTSSCPRGTRCRPSRSPLRIFGRELSVRDASGRRASEGSRHIGAPRAERSGSGLGRTFDGVDALLPDLRGELLGENAAGEDGLEEEALDVGRGDTHRACTLYFAGEDGGRGASVKTRPCTATRRVCALPTLAPGHSRQLIYAQRNARARRHRACIQCLSGLQ